MNTYLATVTDDLYVIVTINGDEINRVGPWDTAEGAHTWAAAIVADLENGIDHFGNNEN